MVPAFSFVANFEQETQEDGKVKITGLGKVKTYIFYYKLVDGVNKVVVTDEYWNPISDEELNALGSKVFTLEAAYNRYLRGL